MSKTTDTTAAAVKTTTRKLSPTDRTAAEAVLPGSARVAALCAEWKTADKAYGDADSKVDQDPTPQNKAAFTRAVKREERAARALVNYSPANFAELAQMAPTIAKVELQSTLNCDTFGNGAAEWLARHIQRLSGETPPTQGHGGESAVVTDLIIARQQADEAHQRSVELTDETWREENGLPRAPTAEDEQRWQDTRAVLKNAEAALMNHEPATPADLATLAELFTDIEICDPEDGLAAVARMARSMVKATPPSGGGKVADMLAERERFNAELEATDAEPEVVDLAVEMLRELDLRIVAAPINGAGDAAAKLELVLGQLEESNLKPEMQEPILQQVVDFLAAGPKPVPPQRVGGTAELIAAWKAQEDIVCDEEEKDDLDRLGRCGTTDIFTKSPDTRAAHAAWKAISEELTSHTPASTADLSLMVDFFAEQCEGGKAETYISGKPCWEHLQRMVRAMATGPSGGDAGLVAVWQQLEEARAAYVQIPENDTMEQDDAAWAPVVAAETAILTTPPRSLSDAIVKLRLILYGLAEDDGGCTPGATELDAGSLRDVITFLERQQLQPAGDDVELAMSIPAEWSQVMTVRPNDPALAEVVRLAIAEGHKPGELAQACYHSHVPGFAPALFFEKANGDVVRVGQEGVLRIHGRHRDGPDPERGQWLCLAERLAEACALGTRIDNQEDPTAEEVDAWSKIDDEVTHDILNLPARSVTGLKVKAKMAVACYGASATPDELNLSDEKTIDVLLAEQIVRTLATM